MQSNEIRSRFLAFFQKRGHLVIPSASLVTSDEKGVTNPTLFNTAGMQPLIPYLLGKSYLANGQEFKRLADSQKCVRTIDIDDVGDKTHATFFEMLGNWSLGDYFKEEAIRWSYEFLTSKEEGLGLDPKRLYVTVFEGDSNADQDLQSAKVWQSVGVPEHRIYFKGADSNWWPAVKKAEDGWTGPTGPCSEMFYDITVSGLGDLTPAEFERADAEQKVVEIWNDVFMEFEKVEGKIVKKLDKKNVDTGAGLERLSTVLQKVDNIYDTDLFKPVMKKIEDLAKIWDLKSARIVADHLRATVFLIADGVKPSNTDRGYVLRKLIRRAVFKMKSLQTTPETGEIIIGEYCRQYASIYPNLQPDIVTKVFKEEEEKFLKTLLDGKREFEKGTDAFTLFSSYGFPLELTLELAKEKGLTVDLEDFEAKFRQHQELSRTGAEQKFKGGLADANNPMIIRYHTATHLLHQALHDVLGEGVGQKGSNITAERLRFDFSYGSKMTEDQKKKVEEIVNQKIGQALPMSQVTLSKDEAEKTGARHFFGEKYGEQVSLYFTGQDLKTAYSKEFCGGPHVKNTSELAGPEGKWRFQIQKEEAVAQGIRRIKAVLE